MERQQRCFSAWRASAEGVCCYREPTPGNNLSPVSPVAAQPPFQKEPSVSVSQNLIVSLATPVSPSALHFPNLGSSLDLPTLRFIPAEWLLKHKCCRRKCVELIVGRNMKKKERNIYVLKILPEEICLEICIFP